MVVSRSLCLFYRWDLQRVPGSRRRKALQQMVQLHSPFKSSGFYVEWLASQALVWVWDQAALQSRLPESAHDSVVVPDSVLTLGFDDGERRLRGINGVELQKWAKSALIDSGMAPDSSHYDLTFDPAMRTTLQPAEQASLIRMLVGVTAFVLVLSLFFLIGAGFKHWQNVSAMESRIATADESLLMQEQARKKAERNRKQLLGQYALLQPGRMVLINEIVKKMPSTVTRLQQLELQPARVQMLLNDTKPNPRNYVTTFDGLSVGAQVLQNVQVQLNTNGSLQFLADINSGKTALGGDGWNR